MKEIQKPAMLLEGRCCYVLQEKEMYNGGMAEGSPSF